MFIPSVWILKNVDKLDAKSSCKFTATFFKIFQKFFTNFSQKTQYIVFLFFKIINEIKFYNRQVKIFLKNPLYKVFLKNGQLLNLHFWKKSYI